MPGGPGLCPLHDKPTSTIHGRAPGAALLTGHGRDAGIARRSPRYPHGYGALLAGVPFVLALMLGAAPTAVRADPIVSPPALAATQSDRLRPLQFRRDRRLGPGEFIWEPGLSPRGPVHVHVSLAEQTAHVFRQGELIGLTTVSTGSSRHPTPPGVYGILQKKRRHHSNLYDAAPMPYMQRLTWDGLALHGGMLPGYPASHGCVRLPHRFAKILFNVTDGDTTVVISDRPPPTAMLPEVLGRTVALADNKHEPPIE